MGSSQALILLQVWLERLFPLLKGFIVAELDSVTAYSLLYQGAVLSNLLEVSTGFALKQ